MPKLLELRGKKIHEILELPGTWTQGHLYRDAGGKPSDVPHKDTTCGCLVGLANFVYPDSMEIRQRIRNKIYQFTITAWNDKDHRTQEEVRELCKELDI